jgi:hypothetical protein
MTAGMSSFRSKVPRACSTSGHAKKRSSIVSGKSTVYDFSASVIDDDSRNIPLVSDINSGQTVLKSGSHSKLVPVYTAHHKRRTTGIPTTVADTQESILETSINISKTQSQVNFSPIQTSLLPPNFTQESTMEPAQ